MVGDKANPQDTRPQAPRLDYEAWNTAVTGMWGGNIDHQLASYRSLAALGSRYADEVAEFMRGQTGNFLAQNSDIMQEVADALAASDNHVWQHARAPFKTFCSYYQQWGWEAPVDMRPVCSGLGAVLAHLI